MKFRVARRGFTLIELLTVVSIIALLAAAILASMAEAQQRSRDATRLSHIKQLQSALEFYAQEHDGQYPLVTTSVVSASELQTALVPSYIQVLPTDPVRTGGNGYRYYTASASNASSYSIVINLETDDPDIDWCLIKLGAGYPNWDQYPACEL